MHSWRQSLSFISKMLGKIGLNSGISTRHWLPKFWTRPFPDIERTKNCWNSNYLLMPKLSLIFLCLFLLPPLQLRWCLELDLGQLVWEEQRKESKPRWRWIPLLQNGNQNHSSCTWHHWSYHQNCASLSLVHHHRNWGRYWKPLLEEWHWNCSYGKVYSFLVKM